MSAEARKELKIKENQAKLEADLAKRASELRAKAGATSAAMNAFFAPRAKPVANTASTPVNPEIRAKYAQYGSNIQDFPNASHVLPSPTLPESALIPSTLNRLQLHFDEESDVAPLIALPEPSEFITFFKDRITSSGSLTPPRELERAEKKISDQHDEEQLQRTAAEMFDAYHGVRQSLGMASSKATLKRQASLTDGVPLLDVRAEDMSAFLAMQQQEAAQRQVAEEQRILATQSTEPAYQKEELEDLYRSMLKQSNSNFALPWSSRFSPQRSRFVCGNSMAANAVKDWLVRWKLSYEALADAAANSRSSSTAAMSSFFTKKTPSSSSLPSTAKTSTTSTQSSQSQPKSNENSQTTTAAEPVSNAFMLSGPIGSGKTSAIYAVAAELGFSVLEINASMKRSGAALRTMVEEATQSRHVGRDASTLTILLFEEVDLSFAEDAGFFQALVSLCESTKRPIILTCQCIPIFLQSKLQSVAYREMRRPDEASIFVHLSFACLASGLTPPPPNIVHQLVLWFDYDLRRLFNNLQFWTPYLSAFGWNFSVRALAGLIVSSDSTDNDHCLKPSRNDLNSIFRYSESKELPDSLDLLHRHFLQHTSPDKAPMSLAAAKNVAEAIAVSDTWHPSPLYDEADTTHDTQLDIFASLQHFTLSADSAAGPCTGCSSCYSLGTSNHLETTLQIVDGVSSIVASKPAASSSSLNRFENISYIGLMANTEDSQRLLNTKRRQFKYKVDWSRVSALQRLRFVRALKLSPVPPDPNPIPEPTLPRVEEPELATQEEKPTVS